MDLEEAREKVAHLADSEARDEEEGEHEPGKKEAWILKGSEFKSVALQTDRFGKVVWVTGFVRPGREIPFAQLGDLRAAFRATETEAIWNVSEESRGYRLVAKGQGGRARVIYLLGFGNLSE